MLLAIGSSVVDEEMAQVLRPENIVITIEVEEPTNVAGKAPVKEARKDKAVEENVKKASELRFVPLIDLRFLDRDNAVTDFRYIRNDRFYEKGKL